MFGFLKKKVEEFSSAIAGKANEKLEAPPPPSPKKPKKKEGLATRIKKEVLGSTKLSEKEIDSYLWDFELALLESDVAHDVAKELVEEIKQNLLAKEFKKGENISESIESLVKAAIRRVMPDEGFDIVEEVRKGDKPFVVLFLGPNGAGKTTSLAKTAHLLKENGLSSVFAASDTFRAASIEQLEEHGKALGIRVIKHGYGADPAAVAFDAIDSAKANNIDCVLIDTAGRQDTNKNLLQELEKISRVAKPHLRLYLDEALAGNALVERVSTFKDSVGVDGIILSKMDLDVKGGGVISVFRSTGIPVVYFGTGQGYSDLEPFNADEIMRRVFG